MNVALILLTVILERDKVIVTLFYGVRLWSAITLQIQWYRSVKVGHEIKPTRM